MYLYFANEAKQSVLLSVFEQKVCVDRASHTEFAERDSNWQPPFQYLVKFTLLNAKMQILLCNNSVCNVCLHCMVVYNYYK